MATTSVSAHVGTHRAKQRKGAETEGPYLPQPPTDEEQFSYFGRQQRWLLAAQSLSFMGIAYSLVRFSVTKPSLIVFLVPITLFCITLAISLASSGRKRRINRKQHDETVATYAPAVIPTVDVFLPSAGEDLAVLGNTYSHVAALDWPADVQVWVLDDSARDEVRQLAEDWGFNYRTRPNRGHLKKAGNLLYGYNQSANDLIVILDADFVPRSDFLRHLVPYFADETVGIVQSPQYFDTRGLSWLQRSAGATQELFYRWVQPSRDKSKAAICVGTCAIYRRAGLEKAGGFAQIGHSEDVHTGVKLMKAGFQLRYIPVIVSKGLCPDDVKSFLNQQYRWCAGSMSLLKDKSFRQSPVISFRQRLCFWSGFLYYISTAINAFIAPLPALAMIYLLPAYVKPANSIPLTGALALWFVILPVVMRGKWSFGVLRVQLLYSFAHALAIRHTMGGRTAEWVATGAGGATPISTSVGRMAKPYIFVTQAALFGGLIYQTNRYGLDKYWAMWVFGLLAAWIHVPVLFMRMGRKAGLAQRWAGVKAQLVKMRDWRHADDVVGSARKFRPDIQGLRAVAVVMVVFYHAHVPGFTGGFAGVDVFFVISGFLITGHLVRDSEKGRISLLKFYAGRVRRLLLPATVVLIVTVGVSRLWGSIFQVKSISSDAIWTALYGINYHLAAQGVNYQNADGPVSPLQHFWSLAVEEQFYLLWPLLVMVFAIGARRYRWKAFGGLLILIGGASFLFSRAATHTNAPYAYFSLQSRAWELCIGAFVYLLSRQLLRKMPGWFARSISWIGLAMIVVCTGLYNDATPFPGTAALLPVMGTAMVIAAGCRLGGTGAEILLRIRPMQALGKFSYGWYLWHWPVLILVPIMMAANFDWIMNLEACAVALWLAILTYYVIEEPSQRWKLSRPVWLSQGALMIGATVAVSSLVIATLPSVVGSGAAAASISLDTSAGTATLQADVEKGTHIIKAPSNMTPTLAQVPHDHPSSSENGCHAGYLQVKQSACVYGDPAGTHTLMLFGDSHAQQWLPAFDLMAQKLHWRVVTWTKAACPIAQVSLKDDTLKRTYTECNQWRTATIAKIKALHPDTIIMSQSDNVPGQQLSDSTWSKQTVATAKLFTSAGLKVTYIMDTPIPGSDAPSCVANHLTNVQACSRPANRAYQSAARHTSMADTLREAGIPIVEPVKWFCTTKTCPMIVGNVLVYRDQTHMTATYSKILAPLVQPLFVARTQK
jgi:peptidoglycan/LPS O-acetylase OafA/YrhL/cellulose synthase/poly-beta-1,6-N-acetylglucosamine synthase-like glycosyltransferase